MLQAFEGLLLDWDAFDVRLPFSSIKDLPSILRALAANATALKAKRRALAAVIPRLLWRVATSRSRARRSRTRRMRSR